MRTELEAEPSYKTIEQIEISQISSESVWMSGYVQQPRQSSGLYFLETSAVTGHMVDFGDFMEAVC